MGVSLGGNSLVFGVAQGIPPIYIYISQSSGKGIMQKMSKVVFFFKFCYGFGTVLGMEGT